jgi:hypothetical protein
MTLPLIGTLAEIISDFLRTPDQYGSAKVQNFDADVTAK